MRTVQIAHSEGRARVARLQNELRLLRGKLGDVNKRQNLGDLLVEVCRERATPAEWRHIVAEARRRHSAQEPLSTVGGLLAGTTRCGETDDPPAALRLDNS